ncbi:EscS/YscS/HrcS family type III secretion system export apparatus protein [Phyllobacterium phragmitis]|uniref:EscS/YscS/HrcS family type III secretion system export apparatus protein n=1 Tax=Phyllobacterium phragmitis TaxID=2670329 RepID=A0A2S9IMJ9_9HYPH|nr:flagellar biosynthetic protein FliQ [Phyllobacterium phragmitis]PRD41759.1 EscS/YscS/HrcS family type III secretion system export apparatus protein [Phyllobacterium phragmitis]
MGQEVFLNEMNRALVTVLIVSAPALGVAIIIGISVGLIQALTQIQDQTLPQAVKLVAVMLVLIFVGPLLAAQVGALASQSLDSFASLTR